MIYNTVKKLPLILFVILAPLFSSLAHNSKLSDKKDLPDTQGIVYKLHSPWVDSVFNSLSTAQRISQLFMVAAYSDRDQNHIDEISALIKDYNIGGILFFHGSPIRQAQQTNLYQSISKTPLLIGIDGEWGLGMRLDSTISFPREMMLGAMDNDSLIYKMGFEIAAQMKSLGIHVNFAPVVDINSNPENPVINNRSFGENKYLVARKGIAYMTGLQANGIIATAKHFPGHGDTNSDSHSSLPEVNFNYQHLDSIELYPFRELIHKHVGGVMVAHLYVPCLDSTMNTASSLSKKIVKGLLVDSMHFQGLIFTDALTMKGVSCFFQPGELEVKALMAGNDILVMPQDIDKALCEIQEAISIGLLRQSQIDSSCRKVLAAKEWAGLKRVIPIDLTLIKGKLNSPVAQLIQRKAIESALTLVQNQNGIVPLKRLDTLKIGLVMMGINKPNQFKETLSLYHEFDCYYLDKLADSVRIDSLMKTLAHYNLIIASIHNTDSRPNKNFGITTAEISFLDNLSAGKPVILDLFATPYALNYFNKPENFKAILVSFEDKPLVQDYSAQLLFGAVGANGSLPVSSSAFDMKTGLKTEKGLRLKYSIPEELHIDSRKLSQIDTIVNNAIKKGAMPGCVILAAKDGIVFYHKAFGYHTYDQEQPTLKSDIYDLASLTKIGATLPAVMHLYEEGKIKLYNKLSVYLPELNKTNKKNLILIDMLTHQARLQPYIPFYWKLLIPSDPMEKLTNNTSTDIYTIKLGPHLYANKDLSYREGLISQNMDLKHGLEVANNMFLLSSYADSIFIISNQSTLRPVKEYKYSDMDFYYLYWMIQRITGEPLNEYVQEKFYHKLGATTLGYLPLTRFDPDQIVQTENDRVFRKQVVHGYVHDPGAAMMGGVCGHAGLFSNANDLAKIMQMYLNKGIYGGEQYFKPSTVNYFSSCPFCNTNNHRGIGFDRPILNSNNGPTCQCVSDKSFGHTGFTGTITWVDPESGLLYVFLSNRVYPDADNIKLAEMNVRTRIQEVINSSLNTYK